MPKMHSENVVGAGSFTWLASDHGLFNARTFTLDAAAFKAVQDSKGKVPSGYPVAEKGGKLVPYKKGGSGGEEVLVGHLLTDQDARYGDVAAPVFYHGSVFTAKVPLESFAAPATQPKSSIVYL